MVTPVVFPATGLSGPSVAPASGKPARQLVVLLHGLGADGNDLIALAPFFAGVLPDAEFLAPDGPQACDMAPMGRQWFSLQEMSPEALEAGIAQAAPILNDFLDRELAKRGLAASQLALVGFSQGTMMALHVGLRRREQIAGIVGFSGMLVAPEKLAAEIASRPSVLLIHGDRDDVLPSDFSLLAEQELSRLEVPAAAHLREGLDHGIDEEGVTLAVKFLADCFRGFR